MRKTFFCRCPPLYGCDFLRLKVICCRSAGCADDLEFCVVIIAREEKRDFKPLF